MSSSDDREPLVVPVGRYLGMLPDASGATLSHTVRLGPRRVELSDDEMLVWALAHGAPGQAGTAWWGRTAVRSGVDGDVDPLIDRLRMVGLLAEVWPEGQEAVGFARSVRLSPLQVGLGNSADEPRVFLVGRPGERVVALATPLFLLWSWACRETDLWAACEVAADLDEQDRSAAGLLLADLLRRIHGLLAAGAACLDPVDAA